MSSSTDGSIADSVRENVGKDAVDPVGNSVEYTCKTGVDADVRDAALLRPGPRAALAVCAVAAVAATSAKSSSNSGSMSSIL